MFLVSVWSQKIKLSLSFSEGVIRTPAGVMLAAVTARLTRPCAEHFMEWLFVSVRGHLYLFQYMVLGEAE